LSGRTAANSYFFKLTLNHSKIVFNRVSCPKGVKKRAKIKRKRNHMKKKTKTQKGSTEICIKMLQCDFTKIEK
jgi:hypothetical protein